LRLWSPEPEGRRWQGPSAFLFGEALLVRQLLRYPLKLLNFIPLYLWHFLSISGKVGTSGTNLFRVKFWASRLAKKTDPWLTAWGEDGLINLWRWTDVL
jgi:hypothetical protein